MDPTHNTLPLSPSPSCRIGVPSPIYQTISVKYMLAVGWPHFTESVKVVYRNHSASP
ncbi:hypothetical protein Hanom_Chr15g01371921 [Helianthus anomalus]